MTEDARFADGAERPLRLVARDAEDLGIVSSLCQDAVFPATAVRWDRKARRFGLLLNRFRWERPGGEAERVQAVLAIDDVMAVRRAGLPPPDADTVLSLLTLTWEPGPDGTGTVLMTLAGDAQIAVAVEALEVVLRDVTRPYRAPSGRRPTHPE